MPVDDLRKQLAPFALPVEATDWLCCVFDAIQVFDDVADGDPVSRRDLNKCIWDSFVRMPLNPFYMAHSATLIPILATMVLKWQGSDTAERAGNADAKSFVWRAGYYDLVLITVSLCHGPEAATDVAHHVMSIYGEKLEDYLEEFGNA